MLSSPEPARPTMRRLMAASSRLLIDEGLAAHDNALVLGDDAEDLLAAQTISHVDVAGLGELSEGFILHQLGDQDFASLSGFQLASVTPGTLAARPVRFLGSRLAYGRGLLLWDVSRPLVGEGQIRRMSMNRTGAADFRLPPPKTYVEDPRDHSAESGD